MNKELIVYCFYCGEKLALEADVDPNQNTVGAAQCKSCNIGYHFQSIGSVFQLTGGPLFQPKAKGVVD